MTIRDRWKKTTISNQLLVIVGAGACIFTALYTAAFFFQLWLINQSNSQASDRTDRLLNNLHWLARTTDRNLEEAENARREAEEQARKVLDASIEAARTDQRAWLGFVEAISDATVGRPFSVRCTIKNSGKTPAIKVSVASVLQPVRTNERPDFTTKAQPAPQVVIQANAVMYNDKSATHELPLTQPAFNQLMSGDMVIHVFGTISYDDVFGFHHWSQYCVHLDFETKSFPNCKEHHAVDSELR